ncbi:hypothetical protein SteCoe_29539 [Stentor coeruleus]|uniref:RING-type domain-containing protein n=1 Tax=Stentor coeruleus TaxID=5963 RepID=A0A1R2B5Q2_9CILI|nr:hypothetical protein SteCoe_29539 [Stentor coeruleus]
MNRSNNNSPKLGYPSSKVSQDYLLQGNKRLPLIKDRPTASGHHFIVQGHIQKREFTSSLSNSKSQKNLEVPQIMNEHKFGKKHIPIDSSIEQEKIINSERNHSHRCNLEIDCHKFQVQDKSSIKLKEESKSEAQSPEISKNLSIENHIEYSSSVDKVEFDYNQSQIEPSTPEYLNELISNLKHEIEVLQKQNRLQSQHQMEMRMIFEKEIDKLTIENNEFEILLNKSHEKNISLMSDMKKQTQEHEELQQKNRETITNTNQNLATLNEELKSKNDELSNISLQFQLSEATKKRYFDSLKKAEIKVEEQKSLYEKSKSKYKSLKTTKTQLLENLETYKKTIQEQEKVIEEHKKTLYEKSLLELNYDEIKNKLIICEESLNTVSHTYSNARIVWKEKEAKYEQIIQDLHEQINSNKEKNIIQISEAVRIKRALTLRDSEIISNFTKDEVNRCVKKCMEQEKECMEQHLEIEKLKKDIDYYKSQLKNKEEIIFRLGLRDNDVISENKITHCKNSIMKICNAIKKYACCNKCMEGDKTFLTVPCNHIMCEGCKNETNLCGVCGGEFSDILGFKYFRLIKEAISTLESMVV